MMPVLLATLLFAPPDEIDELVRALADDDWQVREEASERLTARGVRARERLERLAPSDPEVQWRLREILKSLQSARSSKFVLCVLGLDERGNPARVHHETDESLFGSAGFHGRLPIGGRAAIPFDTVVRLGTFEGMSTYAVARRGVDWFEKSPGEALRLFADPLREAVEAEIDLEGPPAFQMLQEVRGMTALVKPLARRALGSRDPFVRRLCVRALERQSGGPAPDDPEEWLKEMSK